MTTVTVSDKGRVVLPVELRKRLGIVPGVRLDVELSEDGQGVVLRPASAHGKKPASVLFDRIVNKGQPVPVEDLQGLAAARKLAGEKSL